MNFFSAISHAAPRRVSISPALIKASALASSSKANIDESQGHVSDPSNKYKKDVQSESAKAGSKARSELNESLDAASPKSKQKPKKTGSGNPEGVGFVEQVGGASASAQHFESEGKNGSKTK